MASSTGRFPIYFCGPCLSRDSENEEFFLTNTFPVSLYMNRKTLEIVRASIRNVNITCSEIYILVMVKMDVTYSKSNIVRIDKIVELYAIQQ